MFKTYPLCPILNRLCILLPTGVAPLPVGVTVVRSVRATGDTIRSMLPSRLNFLSVCTAMSGGSSAADSMNAVRADTCPASLSMASCVGLCRQSTLD